MAADKNDPLAEGRKLQAEAVAAQEEADKQQPTPTQEEIDRARLGLADGEKAESAEKPGTYKTRDAKS